jgi:hypothetical protein
MIGIRYKTFLNTSGDYDSPTWYVVPAISDESLKDAFEDAAAGRRGAAVSESEVAVRTLALDLKVLKDRDDPRWLELQEAFYARSSIDVLSLSDGAATHANGLLDLGNSTNAVGIRFLGKLHGFNEGRNVNDAIYNETMVKPQFRARPSRASISGGELTLTSLGSTASSPPPPPPPPPPPAPVAVIDFSVSAGNITLDGTASTGVSSFEWTATTSTPDNDYGPITSPDLEFTFNPNEVWFRTASSVGVTLSINGGAATDTLYISKLPSSFYPQTYFAYDSIAGTPSFEAMEEAIFLTIMYAPESPTPGSNGFRAWCIETETDGGAVSNEYLYGSGTLTLDYGKWYDVTVQETLYDTGTILSAAGPSIEVLTAPGPPTGLTVLATTETGPALYDVSLGWNALPGIFDYYEYGVNETPVGTSTDGFGADVFDVIPGDIFFVRAYNASGPGPTTYFEFEAP